MHNAGKISANDAEEKALEEFKKYRQNQDQNYISDFDREVKKILGSVKVKDGGEDE